MTNCAPRVVAGPRSGGGARYLAKAFDQFGEVKEAIEELAGRYELAADQTTSEVAKQYDTSRQTICGRGWSDGGTLSILSMGPVVGVFLS
jgi:predicted esterase